MPLCTDAARLPADLWQPGHRHGERWRAGVWQPRVQRPMSAAAQPLRSSVALLLGMLLLTSACSSSAEGEQRVLLALPAHLQLPVIPDTNPLTKEDRARAATVL